MKSSSSPKVFCNEPWVGVLSVEVNRDAIFCPCYLKLKLGNLDQASLQELWNAEPLIAIRREFAAGRLPDACRGQLCAPALGNQSYLTAVPAADDDGDT
jgi:hypothetical protein